MLKDISLKSVLMGAAGIILVGFGAGMLAKTGYGADTLNACFTGIVNITHLSLGTINTIFNAAVIIFIYLADRKLVGIGMILSIFLLKWPIDYAVAVCPAAPDLLTGIILDVLSLLIFSFGGALMIESQIGSTVYDGLTLIITERSGKPFRLVRYCCDGISLLLGILLKGEIGIGTLLSLLLMAPFIDLFRKMITYQKHEYS